MNSLIDLKRKALLRTIIARFYYGSGLFNLHLWWRFRVKRNVLVLVFHRVLPADSPALQHHLALRSLIVTQENFLQVLKFLQKYFRFLPLPEFWDRARRRVRMPQPCCLITFDDGYQDFLHNAWPILQTHHLPATVFLPTALIGTSHHFWWDELYYLCMHLDVVPTYQPADAVEALVQRLAKLPCAQRQPLVYPLITLVQDWPAEKLQALLTRLASLCRTNGHLPAQANALMNWEEVKALRKSGVHFGSHTRHHLNLATLPAKSLQEEVVCSKQELEAILQEPIEALAFPGGHCSPKVQEAVAEAGYSLACNSRRGIYRPGEDTFDLRRINIWDGMLQDFRGRFSTAVVALNLMRT
jgi:peptidoglycan/xylan/chitin deacetylase (PgdA/CDA1 family)